MSSQIEQILPKSVRLNAEVISSPSLKNNKQPLKNNKTTFQEKVTYSGKKIPEKKKEIVTKKAKPNNLHERVYKMKYEKSINSCTGLEEDFHTNPYYGVFDIETQRSAQEVGGWHKADLMGISCVVLYDSKEDAYLEFLEDQVPEFVKRLTNFDVVIGFNNKRFDNLVLRGYSNFNFDALPTLDILEEVQNHLGYRLSLDNLASVTLGSQKSANGLQALKWWKQGKIQKIVDYCKIDVKITKDLFLYGKENGYLLFKNKAGNSVRVPVNW